MRSPTYFQAFFRGLALSLVVAAGGCLTLEAPGGAPCVKASDCPGEDTACGTRACEQGVCRFMNVLPAGERPPGQPLDDCLDVTCDGLGHAVVKSASDQLPDDGSECTEDKCVEGTPLFVPLEQNAPCGKDKQLKCDGLGSCTGCTMPSDCGDDGPCLKWSCPTESKVCIRVFEPAGTIVADTVKGDCKAEACDGKGKLDQIPYPQDAADDGDPCTDDICSETGTVHGNAATGTACGVGCQSCTDGVCGDCSPGFFCEGMGCVSVGEQSVGAVCMTNPDCATGFCVQGVCCESACDGKCMGCVNTATGMPNGVCAPALDGNNPGGRCVGADVCVGGTCRCENGVQDGSETKVDCGGSCAPCKGTWVCNGDAGCGAPIAQCCNFDCFRCEDQTAACFEIQSKECFIGEQPRSFTAGTVQENGCVNCKRMTCICQ
ncbi:hypothetical protein [Polyangium sp. 15x6]|uniref:hypothetical protein n=1 Tax=Polyangium sp. 15x6 TaxID=3042687 RepID=UPI00249A7C79|nr:hypothetical protein [Polyangium sp. 15x6]MDI3285874.1 hypothetical protein [Polyangium sp. 15x6]